MPLSLDTPQTRTPDPDVQVPGLQPELALLGALDIQMVERLVVVENLNKKMRQDVKQSKDPFYLDGCTIFRA